MIEIASVAAASPTAVRGRRSGASSGFRIDQPADSTSLTASGPEAEADVASLAVLLSAQEVGLPTQTAETDDDSPRNAKGRQLGWDLLRRLTLLQRHLLSGAVLASDLSDLVLHCSIEDQLHDPRLVEVLAEIRLRARIELARLGVEQMD